MEGLVSRQRLCDDTRPLIAKVTGTKTQVTKTLTVQDKLEMREGRERERGEGEGEKRYHSVILVHVNLNGDVHLIERI